MRRDGVDLVIPGGEDGAGKREEERLRMRCGVSRVIDASPDEEAAAFIMG